MKAENFQPFAPLGFAGISAAAASIFFAYVGFDAVSTAAEETKDPQRNVPIGLVASLLFCTVFYILVAAGEACTNVVRHAPAGEPPVLELNSRRDGDISITVRNQGRWRNGFRPGDGGRGLAIIEELMDEVHITRGPPETVVTLRYALGERQTAQSV